MHKAALSPQTTLNYLRARSQQGVSVAPRLLDAAQSLVAAGGHTTPAPLRGLALHTADSAQAARRAQQFAAHPIPSARRAAAETVMELEHAAPERMFASPKILQQAEMPAPSAEKTQMLFGGGGQLHDPDRLMTPMTPVMSQAQMLEQLRSTSPSVSGVRSTAREAGTAVGRVPRPASPPPASDATAIGRPVRKIAATLERHPISLATNTPGRLRGQLPQDPAETARTAFWGNQRQVEESMADTPKLAFSYQDLRRLGNRPVSSFFRRGAQAAEAEAAPIVNKIMHQGMEVTPNLKGEVDFMMPAFGDGKILPGGAQPVQFGSGSYEALGDAGALVVPDYVKNFKPSELVAPAFVRGESPIAHAAEEPIRRRSKRQMAMWMDPVPPPQAAAHAPAVSAPAPVASAPAPAVSAPAPVAAPTPTAPAPAAMVPTAPAPAAAVPTAPAPAAAVPTAPAPAAPASDNRLRYIAGGLAAAGTLGAGGAYLANRNDAPPLQKAASARLAAWAEKGTTASEVGKRKKVAGDTGAPQRNLDSVFWGTTGRSEFQEPTGIVEKPRGLAPAGGSRLILGEPALRQDRIDRSFGYMDNDQNTTAIEGAWGSPGTASTSIP